MTGQIVHLEPDPHVAVQQLLPWYLTDRLSPAEREQVEGHLAACPQCRAELETERQWQRLPAAAGGLVDVEDGWARMRARLGDGQAADEDDDVP
ncbi:MAG TPA: zf-HC2 domain-containing protein, partial [Burkholderiaceae bacterium]